MIKYLIISVYLFTAFVFSRIVSQDVRVEMEVPAEVRAGSEFFVKVNISKSALESFSRLQQDLPYGLTAYRVSAANADFSFDNQKVRHIWLRLPADPIVTVVYRIDVDTRLKGNFKLNAEFSYIDGNERKTIQVESPEEITIIPNPEIAVHEQIDIRDFEEHYLAELELAKTAPRLQCLRMEPVQSGRDIIIELLVNKGNIDRFAKIEEYIPSGFIAGELESEDGIFSFENQTVKILWMDLPDEQEFTVKYRLIPERGRSIDDLRLSGSFSYIEGNQTRSFEILGKKPEIAVINGDQMEEHIVIHEPEQPEIEIENMVEVRQEVPAPEVNVDEKWLIPRENGIYYRVQLAAGRNPVNIPKYFQRLSVKENVGLEFHEGWRKYSVGSFRVYREARDHRMLVWQDTPIKDAFVAAYNNGHRITVQEALMITNQQWFR